MLRGWYLPSLVLVRVVAPVRRRERPQILLFLLARIGGHEVLLVAVRAGVTTGGVSQYVLDADEDMRENAGSGPALFVGVSTI